MAEDFALKLFIIKAEDNPAKRKRQADREGEREIYILIWKYSKWFFLIFCSFASPYFKWC